MSTIYVVAVAAEPEHLDAGDVENVLSNVTEKDIVVTSMGRVLFSPEHDVEIIS